MPHRRRLNNLALPLVLLTAAVAGGADRAAAAGLHVSPARVALASPEASTQLVVLGAADDGRAIDLTRDARYRCEDPQVATVSPRGQVRPVADGQTEVVIETATAAARVTVAVEGVAAPQPVSFSRQIVPILTKAGCNSGGCHGKAEGQNGFKLSVFGFDPAGDHAAIVKQARGRRVAVAAPRHSLMLQKASGQMPHGGGVKIHSGGHWHRLLSRWIAEGARHAPDRQAALQRIAVFPDEIVLQPGEAQQLRVDAVYSDGRRRCVTAEAEFQSNAEAVAGVDRNGLIQVTGVPGEAAMLVRHMGSVAVARVTLPQAGVTFPRPPEHNFVDRLVWDKLQRLGIEPSGLADDATFLRRACLDVTGTLPTAEEARRFLDDVDPDKRTRLVDRLLDRDEYADYQALRWADILRVDRDALTPAGAVAMTRWLRTQFRENTPWDQFARQLVLARGSTLAESPAGFYLVHEKPEEMARSISQLLLGVRIECAQCHHHPFERWGQRDYYALAGFFSGVKRQAGAAGGHKIVSRGGDDLTHPRTGQPVPAAGLGAPPAEPGGGDRRQPLADWITSPNNPYFARAIVNRLWAHYFGRGLVEPIDDIRATNPAVNEPLLDALAGHLIDSGYDLKAVTRTLLLSRAYQLRPSPTATNVQDERNFSRAQWRPLPAEVLLDAICQASGSAQQFNGWPAGYRAVEIWDNRMPSYFFRIFGRPSRVTVCQCERGSEPSMAQALHLMNSPETVHKIRHRDGTARRLADSDRAPEDVIEELYLATVSRRPSPDERALMREAFRQSPSRRSAVEDVLWTLLNTREFVFNH